LIFSLDNSLLVLLSYGKSKFSDTDDMNQALSLINLISILVILVGGVIIRCGNRGLIMA
jgi:hypothetical protein